jgi:gamma-glutamyl-gamma-aminobutyrate hydrolase PuuD
MKGKKLRVALPVNVFETTVGQKVSYMDFFSEFGEVVLVTTQNDFDDVVKNCDVLALPGGSDVLSKHYGRFPSFNTNTANPHYEYFDTTLLPLWLETGKPIIAICRGMQALNVHMGGTLHPHINGHVQDPKYGRAHADDEMYTDMPGREIVMINSFHHQGIDVLAPGFEILGWSTRFFGCPSGRRSDANYGNHIYEKVKNVKQPVKSKKLYTAVAELIAHTTLPYIGFQYHPEDMMDEFSLSLVDKVLSNYNNQTNYGFPKTTTKQAQEQAN